MSDVCFMSIQKEAQKFLCYRICFVIVFTFKVVFWHFQVECPKYPGFCISRQKTEYPFVEIFHTPEQVRMSFPHIFLF